MKKKIIALLIFFPILPTIVGATSITNSLIQGLSPTEAIKELANQIDSLLTRVETVEENQSEIATTTQELMHKNEILEARISELESKPPQIIETIQTIETKEIIIQAPPEPEIEKDLRPAQINLNKLKNYFENNEFFKDGLYGTVGINEWEYVKEHNRIASIEWRIDGKDIEGVRPISTGSKKMVLDTTKYTNGTHALSLFVLTNEAVGTEESIEILINN